VFRQATAGFALLLAAAVSASDLPCLSGGECPDGILPPSHRILEAFGVPEPSPQAYHCPDMAPIQTLPCMGQDPVRPDSTGRHQLCDLDEITWIQAHCEMAPGFPHAPIP
jgi:hypothetical protein